MTQYGDHAEPGIVTDLTSTAAVQTAGGAPSDVCLVGQANLGGGANQGSADPNTVHQVTRASKAEEWFGDPTGSLLTAAIIDALNEGAFPVYAVATASNSATEDISGVSSTTVSLANGPIREDPASVTVTLDGTDLTTHKVYDDVSTYSPASGECYYNPVRANVELPAVPGDADSTNDTVQYEHFDYPSAHTTVAQDAGSTVDFLAPINENQSVCDDANQTVANMEQEYDLASALVAADIRLDPATYTQKYDDSRTQTIYPTRFTDDTSALGAYAGRRAALGLETTPVNKRLKSDKRLVVNLSRQDRSDLISANVVPLSDEARGPRIVDDPTTVSSSNTDEGNIDYGFERMVMDFIIATTKANEEPFIGRLNSPTVRRTFEGMVRSELRSLEQSNLILSYSVNVAKADATTAELEVGVELAAPLRFIENTVSVGQ